MRTLERDIRLRIQGFIPKRGAEISGLSLVSFAWEHRIELDEDGAFRKTFEGSLNRIACGLSNNDVVWLTNSTGFPTGREQLCRWLIMNVPLLMADLRTGLAAQRDLVLKTRRAKSLEGLSTCPFCWGPIDAEHDGAADADPEAMHSQCEWISTHANPKECNCDKCAAERLVVFGAES